MFEMWLKEIVDNRVYYFFQIEKNGKKGIVEFDKDVGEIKIVEEAETSSICIRGLMLARLLKACANGIFNKYEYVAWY